MQEGAQPDTWDMMACSRASENGVTSLTVQWRVHDSVVCSVDGRDEAVPRAATSLVAAFRRGLLVRWRGRRRRPGCGCDMLAMQFHVALLALSTSHAAPPLAPPSASGAQCLVDTGWRNPTTTFLLASLFFFF